MIAEYIAGYVTSFISWGGYPAVFVLMALESMIAPVPSEAVMPFAGFLIHEGVFSFELVVLASTLGSIAGSIISYLIGAYGGKPAVKAVGRYLLIDMHHLELTEGFFSRHGGITIFISRFIPVVRHLISIPAGMGRMHPVKFVAYTAVGAGCWNAFLAYAGYILRSNWEEVLRYSQLLDLFIILAMLAAFLYLLNKYRKRNNKKK